MSDWEGKSYFLNEEIDSLGAKPFLASGEIIRHKAGAHILRCPACNAVQFVANELQGEASAPTFAKPLRCACVRCACEFRIRSGKAIEVGADAREC